MAKRKVTIKRDNLKTYIFRVVLEEDRWPDEPPSEAVWRAYVPSLESLGASTWGETPPRSAQEYSRSAGDDPRRVRRGRQTPPPLSSSHCFEGTCRQRHTMSAN
jgi:hypothetical protein